MIDITKKYCYRNGEPARILCVDAPSSAPVISLTQTGMVIYHFSGGSTVDECSYHERDLIEVKEKTQCPHCGQEMEKASPQKHRLEFWMNIYPGNRLSKWTNKHDADQYADEDRVACKHVVIEYEEGEVDE